MLTAVIATVAFGEEMRFLACQCMLQQGVQVHLHSACISKRSQLMLTFPLILSAAERDRRLLHHSGSAAVCEAGMGWPGGRGKTTECEAC